MDAQSLPVSGADSTQRNRLLAGVGVCFFLSGFAGLLYETVWLRQFAAIFGTSEAALGAILASYMGGLALESDFTASTSLGAIYTINDRLELDMRYRGLWVDYESGDPGDADYFEYDTVTHGPLIGLKINL